MSATESLVAGRTRRANAGNKMRELLEKEHLRMTQQNAEIEKEDEEYNIEEEEEAERDIEISSESSDEEAELKKLEEEGEEVEKILRDEERIKKRKIKKNRAANLQRTLQPPKRPTPSAASEVPKKKYKKVKVDPSARRTSSRMHTVLMAQSTETRLQEAKPRRKYTVSASANRQKGTMTQQQRFEEAAKTEAQNLSSLRNYVHLEEQRRLRLKRNAAKHRQLREPILKFISKTISTEDGKEASNYYVAPLEHPLCHSAPPLQMPQHRAVECVITGKPAIYLDPVTQLPISNVQAFQQVREVYNQRYSWSAMLNLFH
ncbi:Swr1 complex subunit Swc2 [Schizosaccharomyces pombe]